MPGGQTTLITDNSGDACNFDDPGVGRKCGSDLVGLRERAPHHFCHRLERFAL